MLVSVCAPFSPFYYHKQQFLFIYIGPELLFMFFTYYFIWSAPNPCVGKYHCQACLTKGDTGNLSDEGFPELNLVPGMCCLEPSSPDWKPCLFWCSLLCLVTPLTYPLASFVTGTILKRRNKWKKHFLIFHTWDLCYFRRRQPRSSLYFILISQQFIVFMEKNTKHCPKHSGRIHRWIRNITYPQKAWCLGVDTRQTWETFIYVFVNFIKI